MNILLLTADAARTSIALVIARGETSCALEGEIVAREGAVQVQLGEPRGQVIHQVEVPTPAVLGAAVQAGIGDVLSWLGARNIRVDLVAHRIAHHAENDHIVRLAPDRVDTLAEFEASKAAVYGIEAVASASPAVPQVAFFAVRPHSPVTIAQAIAAAGLHAPAGCPKKLKVRCESCCAS